MNDRFFTKYEVQAEINVVVKIQNLIKNYVIPWEQQNPDQCFFTEMFMAQFKNWRDPFLIKVSDN